MSEARPEACIPRRGSLTRKINDYYYGDRKHSEKLVMDMVAKERKYNGILKEDDQKKFVIAPSGSKHFSREAISAHLDIIHVNDRQCSSMRNIGSSMPIISENEDNAGMRDKHKLGAAHNRKAQSCYGFIGLDKEED